MQKNKTFGSILIIAGTALGAGMMALPLVSAGAGFLPATLMLFVIWALMVYTGLLILEVTLAFPKRRNNFSSMATATLGISGKIVSWLAMMALLYSLAAAYISGGASILSESIDSIFNIDIPAWSSAIIFTLVLGGAVYWSTKATDMFNRSLLSIKGFLLIMALILLMPHIDITKLASSPNHAHLIFLAAPIFLCAFGFHHIIPSLTNYLDKHTKSLKLVIIIGATIPLVIYFFWLLTTLGIMESSSLHGSVGTFISKLIHKTQSKWIAWFVNGFSNIAMTTSFLGVTLGLFDFLADAFKRQNSRVGRTQTALLTFIPPFAFALLFPEGFVLALGYAAIFVAVLEIILPTLMVYKLRKNPELKSQYRAFGGTWLLLIVGLTGVGLIGLQFLAHL